MGREAPQQCVLTPVPQLDAAKPTHLSSQAASSGLGPELDLFRLPTERLNCNYKGACTRLAGVAKRSGGADLRLSGLLWAVISLSGSTFGSASVHDRSGEHNAGRAQCATSTCFAGKDFFGAFLSDGGCLGAPSGTDFDLGANLRLVQLCAPIRPRHSVVKHDPLAAREGGARVCGSEEEHVAACR